MLSDQMIKYLPDYERKSKIFQELMRVEGLEFDKQYLSVTDFKRQLFIDTATWGLVIYEKELGIKTDLSKSYDDRRSVIKSKWRGAGKIDRTLIKLVADAYTNGDVEVAFNGRIIIEFNSVRGIPPNMNDLKAVLEDIRPSHLGIEYVYLYLIWNDFDSYNKTWDQWDALNLTWDQLEVYGE